MKNWRWLLPLALMLVIVPAFAQEEHGHEHGEEMPAEMQAWMALASPNEHHAHLAKMSGEWDLTIKVWMEPGAPPTESAGTSFNEMILDGRFLQSTVHSTFMGRPFTGVGLDGYDNLKKKHIGMWIDTAGTMMLQFEGDCSDDGKVLNTMAHFLDPMSGESKPMKGKITLVGEDEFTYESWEPGPDGEMFRRMEITYKRKS